MNFFFFIILFYANGVGFSINQKANVDINYEINNVLGSIQLENF